MTLRLDAVCVRAGGRALFAPVTLAVAPGACVTVMGPSGSGKSSLLAAVSGALPRGLRGEGRISLGGEDVTHVAAHKRRIGILFQDDLLFPHMTVADNLLFGLSPEIAGRDVRRDAIEVALREAELPGYGPRDPATLSGGQRARVALMRALLSRPRALLLDEPFSALDVVLRSRFRALVLASARARALPVLLATHDPSDASGTELLLQPFLQDSASAPP